MKSIKYIFAFTFLSIFLTACSATATADDDEIYVQEQVQFTGGDTAAEINTNRD
ncbi:hypothetical protein [Lutibacter flavus]|uniref:Uncharacterized protein n=1 Tax=Lutibacter flavus TaxID=691689 RepID=A0A238WXC6_9FLAO|nr:hypothetical protein [Lutibacter flavus]SNR51197.1 hypothetical protein SAMN04488111_1317 [Lutibacter flavus]